MKSALDQTISLWFGLRGQCGLRKWVASIGRVDRGGPWIGTQITSFSLAMSTKMCRSCHPSIHPSTNISDCSPLTFKGISEGVVKCSGASWEMQFLQEKLNQGKLDLVVHTWRHFTSYPRFSLVVTDWWGCYHGHWCHLVCSWSWLL